MSPDFDFAGGCGICSIQNCRAKNIYLLGENRSQLLVLPLLTWDDGQMTTDEMRNYLEEQGYSYQWITRRLRVERSTVKNWFSRSFPEIRKREVERIIREDQRRQSSNHLCAAPCIMAFILTPEQYRDAQKMADKQGLPADEYARRLLLERLGYDDAPIGYF